MSDSFPSINRLQRIRDFGLKRYRSKDDFIDHLGGEGFDISKRTLNRDFKQLEELGYEVSYQPNIKKHYINDTLVDKQNLMDRMIELQSIKSFERDYSKLYTKYVIDDESNAQGIEFIRPIFEAVDNRKSIKFDYHKFDGSSSKRHIHPLQLKLNLYRWYVIGHDKDREKMRIFGLDRIKNLETKDRFDPDTIPKQTFEELRIQKYYYGISKPILNDEKLQRVVLEVSPFLTSYWRSKPVHHTQEILEMNTSGNYIVELYIVPNIELIKLIVSSLGEINVIEPQAITNYIKENHSSFFQQFTFKDDR